MEPFYLVSFSYIITQETTEMVHMQCKSSPNPPPTTLPFDSAPTPPPTALHFNWDIEGRSTQTQKHTHAHTGNSLCEKHIEQTVV